ncbi:MAG: helix-turn-helix domain-containing protein [Chitinophagales bacterium]
MELHQKIFEEINKLNRKIDRISAIVQGLPTTHNTDLGEWLTEEQARELLQRGATSLWDLRKRKKITASKIGNRTYYNRQSIINYIDKNKIK